MITFEVYGTPAGQGSKKHVGNGRMIETSKKLPAWRNAVEQAAKTASQDGQIKISGPTRASVTIWLPRPKTTRHKAFPAGPPDLDKLQRAIGDALTKSRIITDDAQITTWHARKRWAIGRNPGATITITEEDL